MANVGALAANFHEGSRSEYLAQYVFASFGTAVSVPHQEDTGVDLYCTMTEQVGALAWPRHHYTVQVKSTMSPWQLGSGESVRWLVEHPLPLFLCLIDKSTARLRLYHTLSRFLVWATGELPNTLELVPEDGSEGESTQWSDGKTFSLSAPVIDRTIMELLDDNIWAETRAVVDFWLQAEKQNLARLTMGVPIFSMPAGYKTNAIPHTGTVFQSNTLMDRIGPVRAALGETLPWLAHAFLRKDDLPGMARAALLLRYLFTEHDVGTLGDGFLQTAINEALGLQPAYFYEGVDLLAKRFDDMLRAAVPSQSNRGT
jgi:hypothetical protein